MEIIISCQDGEFSQGFLDSNHLLFPSSWGTLGLCCLPKATQVSCPPGRYREESNSLILVLQPNAMLLKSLFCKYKHPKISMNNVIRL